MATQTIGLEAVFDISKFTSSANSYKRELNNLNSVTVSTSSSMTQAGSSIGSIGAIAGGAAVAGVAALTAAVGALGVGLAASVGEAANFQQGIADIAAVTGNSIEAVGELKDLALDLSLDPQLSVTANEAAGALEVLAKNGVEAEAILAGVGRSTIEIANATGEDFALAADVATDALNLFGIEADEFAKVGDNITGVLVNSKFGLNDVRLALAQGGAVAASAGIEFDEFAAVIAATSSNFASGSDAGTAFKTFIQRLTAPTDKAKSQLEQLGISVFDAEGKMRSITDIFEQFRNIGDAEVEVTTFTGSLTSGQEDELVRLKSTLASTKTSIRDYQNGIKGLNLTDAERSDKLNELSAKERNLAKQIGNLTRLKGEAVTTTRKLTEEEKQEALTTVFGADAIRFATGAMNLQEGQLEDLTAALNKEGLAQQAAATRTETFKGAIDRLKSAYEFLKITVGTPFLSPLTAFFDDTVTPGIRLLGSLAAVVGDVTQSLDRDIGADLGIGGDVLADAEQIARAFGTSFERGLEVAGRKITRVIDNLFGDTFDFSAFTNDVSDTFDTIGAAFDRLLNISSAGGLAIALGFSPESVGIINQIANSFTQLFTLITSFDLAGLQSFDFLGLFGNILGGLNQLRISIINGLSSLVTDLSSRFVTLLQSPEFVSGAAEFGTWLIDSIVAGITAAASGGGQLVGAVGGLVTALGNAAVTVAPALLTAGQQIIAAMLPKDFDFSTAATNLISGLFTSLSEKGKELAGGFDLFSLLGGLAGGAVAFQGITTVIGPLTTAFTALSTAAAPVLAFLSSTALATNLATIGAGIGALLPSLGPLPAIFGAIAAAITTVVNPITLAIGGFVLFGALIGSNTDQLVSVGNAVLDFLAPAFEDLAKAFALVGEDLATLGTPLSGLYDSIVAAIPSAQEIALVIGGVFVGSIYLAIEAISILVPIISAVLVPALSGLITVGEGVISFFSGFVAIISGAVTGDLARASEGLQQIVGGILTFTEGILVSSVSIIAGIIDGLVQGITGESSSIADAFITFISSGVDAFKEFLGINSDSTMFIEFGANIVGGLVTGLVDNASKVATALTGIVTDGISSFGKALDLPDFELPGFLGGGEEGQGEAGGIFEFAKGIKDNLGSALEETGDIVSATVAPAFEDVSAVTGLFNTEAQEGANIANGQLSPALSRVGSIAQTNTTPSLRAASDAIQQNTNQAQKLASILNGQLNSASETFAELWARIGSNAEDAIEPLTEVKNLLGEIASFLQAIQAAGGGSAGQAAQASGGASTAGATAAGAFQSFSSVRNTNTNNTFNLTVNSSQSSRGVIGDFGRLQALV